MELLHYYMDYHQLILYRILDCIQKIYDCQIEFNLMISQLLKLFNVENIYKLVAIFLVFAISGIVALYLSELVTNLLEVYIENSNFILTLRICSLFILYQFVILIVSIPFGQLNYFLTYQKKVFKRFSSIFLFFHNK